MNALAAAALALLAATQDPRAFQMPKKATPPKAEQPAKPEPPATEKQPVQPAPAAPAAEPAPAPPPQKPLMFELPKPLPETEAAPATGNAPRATDNGSRATPSTRFTLPGDKPRRKKAPTPRTFRLPDKNDVSN